jgi:hypothetical protein
MMVSLHGIVLVFALTIIFFLTGGDIKLTYALSETDPALSHALGLGGLLIGGNMLGIILILTPLFRSFVGSCVLVIYELAFLGISLIYLTPDYSFAIGFIGCAMLYVANQRSHEPA